MSICFEEDHRTALTVGQMKERIKDARMRRGVLGFMTHNQGGLSERTVDFYRSLAERYPQHKSWSGVADVLHQSLERRRHRMQAGGDGDACIALPDVDPDELMEVLVDTPSLTGGKKTQHHVHRGRKYVVREGPRGGLYILAKGERVYVKK